MPIRCLIVDDEPIAAKVIRTHLEKVPDVVIVAICGNALEAFDLVRKEAVDLLFLDIQMPQLTGLDFVQALEHPPAVIFTTAYRDYAVEGFDLDAVDYLLKPISLPRLLRAVDRFRTLQALKEAAQQDAPQALQAPHPLPTLNVRANRQVVKIPLGDILFVESLSDYLKIHTPGRTVVTKQRISRLETRLTPHGFLRIHRSFLVAVSKITAFTAEHVQVGTHTLPISRSYKQTVLGHLRANEGL